jgi:DNA-binding GntR family transcriptional regulator
VLSRLLDNVYAQILVLRLRSLYLPERLQSSLSEHLAIFAAVTAGDAVEAERLSRAHAEHVLEDAVEFIERGGPGAGPAPADARTNGDAASPDARARRASWPAGAP